MLSNLKYISSLKLFQSIYQLLVFAFFLLLALGYVSNPNLTVENGLYENIQLFFLVMATFISILALRNPLNERHKYLMIGFFLLSLTFLLREMEFSNESLPVWFVWAASADGALYISLFLFIPFIIYSILRFSFVLNLILEFMLTYNFYRFTFSGLLLILGGVYDREWIFSEHNVFLEEFFETLAYYIYLIAMYYMLPSKNYTGISILSKKC
jgi:hypothetical protein